MPSIQSPIEPMLRHTAHFNISENQIQIVFNSWIWPLKMKTQTLPQRVSEWETCTHFRMRIPLLFCSKPRWFGRCVFPRVICDNLRLIWIIKNSVACVVGRSMKHIHMHKRRYARGHARESFEGKTFNKFERSLKRIVYITCMAILP